MKSIKSIVIIVFSVIILLPLIFFNFTEDAISIIDNKKLAPSPLKATSGSLTDNIDSYMNDRIGLREEMIYAYTMLNDMVLNKLSHPSYIRGKNGYIFGGEATQYRQYDQYHIDFANMVAQIQRYCEQRDVPFVFVFNPAKSAVLTEHLPTGINYDRSWVDLFFAELEKLGVNYVDNTKTLREMNQKGEFVFNQQYDANHWNDLGAYYGTNEILKALQKEIPTLHINTKEELRISHVTETKLPNSVYPIQEQVPKIALPSKITSLASQYSDEIELHASYKGFNYLVNEKRKNEGAPKALVFQGSYMNGCGNKYLCNSFGEYVYVHDYQNVMNFDYYYNIFKPDCVVFEVAEYTFTEGYFSQKAMQTMKLNAPLISVDQKLQKQESLASCDFSVEKGETLTKITWNTSASVKSVWLVLDEEYDMKQCESGYSVTLPGEVYDKFQNQGTIVWIE